jgi:hypothetical protein
MTDERATKLAAYEERQGRMSSIAEMLADEYGGDSADWEDIAWQILDRHIVMTGAR